MFVLICYDVPAKRTEIYKKLLKEYLVHEQASVFMGDLPESDLISLVAKISDTIEPEDQIMKLICRNRHNIEIQNLTKEALGGPVRQENSKWHGKNWSIV